jgi:hypothetical protein
MDEAQLQNQIAEAAIRYCECRWLSDFKRSVAATPAAIRRRQQLIDDMLAAEAALLTAVRQFKRQNSRAGATVEGITL